MNTKTFWILTVVFAFASVISFFQINSAWADAHNFNTGWKVLGALFAIVAIFCVSRVAKNWGSGGGQ